MTERRRILVLTPNLLGSDGVSSLSRSLVDALEEKRRQSSSRLEVWSLNESSLGESNSRGEGVIYRFASGSKARFAFWAMRAAMSLQSTLVVVVHPGLAPVLLPFSLTGARTAIFLLGIDAWRPMGGLDALAIRRASIVAAISHHTAARFRDFNPWMTKRIDVCHLAAAPLVHPPKSKPCGERFALIVARMASEERYKGHDLLLDLWPDLLREVPDARLVIAGDGDDRPRLEEKARRLSLGQAVEFTGRVSDARLAELYDACAFFVMPSRDEGFGLVFLEAMRAGKPCIGAAGAAAEIIVDGETGFVVDSDRLQQLQGALVRLFREGGLRIRMGDAGRLREQAVFSVEEFRRRLFEILGV
jgi:phosphatidylinositol alpha-1,6-mannosyltransferase